MYRELRSKVNGFAKKSDIIGSYQFISTLFFYLLTWCIYFRFSNTASVWFSPVVLVLVVLLNCRFFSLMHDCGHGALFKSRFLNKTIGFVIGVIMGLSCYVWALDHAFHHKTNGDWESYPGSLEVIPVKEYHALSSRQKKLYRFSRSLWIAPFVGLFYLIILPRVVYLFHVFAYIEFAIKKRLPNCKLSRQRSAPTWPRTLTKKEFIYMTLNNLVFVPLVACLSLTLGFVHFLIPFCLTLSLAGTIVFIIFISQHTFENSYATTKDKVDPLLACLHGTSFLKLPAILNYFTADIAYHHIHHLSAQVPNYRLKQCHEALSSHFLEVRRMTIKDVFNSLKFNLWDVENQCLITCQQYDQMGFSELTSDA